MDPKAAAKSKRQQSQQGKRNHPTPSAASAHKKKEPLTQPKQAQQHRGEPRSRGRLLHHHHHHRQGLPSNWDRYDDDDDEAAPVEVEEGGHAPVPGNTREPAGPSAGGGDALAPKSKGADFRYLIEQARSQPRDRDCGDGGTASASLSDEIVPDFVQGLISLVSAKGESLLSWCSNDNFTVDNDTGSSFEVPFLSIDVNALAAQLSKLSMAQRLFIEEDILPTELHDHVETENSTENELGLVDDAFPGAQNEQAADGQSKSSQPKGVESHDNMQRSGKGASVSFSQGQERQDPTNSFGSQQCDSKRHSRESWAVSDMNSIQVSASRFEAATAEADLDRLLDSFGVTNDLASSGLESNTFATNRGFTDRLVHLGATSSRQESTSLSKAGVGVSLEDTIDEILAESNFSNSSSTLPLSVDVSAGSSRPSFGDTRGTLPLEKSIDDLLAETSFLDSSGMDGQSNGALAQENHCVSSVHVGAPSQRDEHDLRHAASTISLDETIDDLLAEKSSHQRKEEHSPHVQGKIHILSDKSNSISKGLDDIDTWLDSI